MTGEKFSLPPQGGILLVDKATGWTSHDVVAKGRRALGTRKVGHAGTLDPLATGLLVLGAGPATRLLTHLVGLDKEYVATIRLGVSTVTDDSEGTTTTVADPHTVSDVSADAARISAAAATLTGDILQSPSSVSAIKVDGRRAYDRVRAGEEVELKQRPVTVSKFTLGVPTTVALPDGSVVIDIVATVRCSSGTYVRALARDLGEILGIGGHLTQLRRTEVGPFLVVDALSNEALAAGDVQAVLEPAWVATRLFPTLQLTDAQTTDLGHGKKLTVAASEHADAELVAAVAPDGRLVGLVKIKNGGVRVVTNFPIPDSVPSVGTP